MVSGCHISSISRWRWSLSAVSAVRETAPPLLSPMLAIIQQLLRMYAVRMINDEMIKYPAGSCRIFRRREESVPLHSQPRYAEEDGDNEERLSAEMVLELLHASSVQCLLYTYTRTPYEYCCTGIPGIVRSWSATSQICPLGMDSSFPKRNKVSEELSDFGLFSGGITKNVWIVF